MFIKTQREIDIEENGTCFHRPTGTGKIYEITTPSGAAAKNRLMHFFTEQEIDAMVDYVSCNAFGEMSIRNRFPEIFKRLHKKTGF